MKILVTGANGYLGQGIVKTLVDNNIETIATGRKTDLVDSRASAISCDLFSIDDPYEFFGRPDAVIHLAWKDGFIHNADSHISNLPLHCDFLNKLAKSGAPHIAVLGSMHEVGFFEGSIDETVPCNPMSCYGIAKNALRQYTQWLSSTTPFTFQWLRGFYIVGNSAYGSSIFSKLATKAAMGEKEFPFTQGINQFDFIDYSDFCFQVAAAVTQEKTNGIINICSGRPEKLGDRVERFIKDEGYDIKLKYGAFPDRPYDSKAVWGNSQKIEKIIADTDIRKVFVG